MKIVAAIISHSLSVISSVVDSGVDLTSGVILFWATRAIKRRDPFLYPQGNYIYIYRLFFNNFYFFII